ncbi:hypothetical protein KA025_02640 [Candidatus Saccharibacteria bacterium]|nr:hypothetical protein [Candidatus Saccharibacteria bacterium]MBP7834962.1 hypothetical protein [Candidatus Saccharibacteria bacterium]
MKRAISTESGRPVVLIDMDNVMANFDEYIIESLSNKIPNIAFEQTRINHYISKDYEHRPDIVDEIHRIKSMPGFFENLEIITGAAEAWDDLITEGYEPVVCSAVSQNRPHQISEKRR